MLPSAKDVTITAHMLLGFNLQGCIHVLHDAFNISQVLLFFPYTFIKVMVELANNVLIHNNFCLAGFF